MHPGVALTLRNSHATAGFPAAASPVRCSTAATCCHWTCCLGTLLYAATAAAALPMHLNPVLTAPPPPAPAAVAVAPVAESHVEVVYG